MNPFRPTAGKMPPILIGREGDVADFFQGLVDGAGAPGRLMLITGQRGFGKTVLLTELCRVARSEGWPVVSETASVGLCERIIEGLDGPGVRVSHAQLSPSVKLAGVADVSLGSLSLEPTTVSRSLRLAIEARLAHVPEGKGVMIAIDEVQAASREEMVAIGTAIQHVIRDQDMLDVPDVRKRGVAFVFAGLPSVMDDLLDDKVLTFLRRSQRHDLGPIALPAVRNAYVQTIAEHGRHIGADVAWDTARATDGFPYMVQLVGYYLWQSAEVRGSREIEAVDVERALPDAVYAFQEAVCAPLYRDLTKAQRQFVSAMLCDDPSVSTVASVAAHADRSASWVRKYRRSLVDAQVILADADGNMSFVVPYMADYLRGRAV